MKWFSVCGLWLFLSFSSHAQNLVVITESWPPYNYEDANGKVVGTATSIVKNMLVHANIEHKIQLLPWPVAYAMLEKRPNILLYSIFRTEEREDKFEWICPIAKAEKISAFQLANRSDIEIKSLRDLKKYRLAVSSKNVWYEYLVNNGFEPHKDFDVSSTEEASLRLLLNNRIDLIIQESRAISMYLEPHDLEREHLKETFTLIDDSVPICAAMNKGSDQELLSRLRRSLIMVKNTAR